MELGAQMLTGVPEMCLTTSADFTETITSLCPHTEEDNVEDFTILTSQQIECEYCRVLFMSKVQYVKL